ncbi:hypothetical protein [Microvirga sp. G4-2]|uniref:hypothetical protein n=1 Tax=Microvirga sp. G4-2 TaxID=3434467 RepID=UPI0040449E37
MFRRSRTGTCPDARLKGLELPGDKGALLPVALSWATDGAVEWSGIAAMGFLWFSSIAAWPPSQVGGLRKAAILPLGAPLWE